MKKIFYYILLLTFSIAEAKPIIRNNENGFPICFSKAEKVYFFIWDEVIHTSTKKVNFFELKDYMNATGHHLSGCDQAQYLQNVPAEILKAIDSASITLFPESVIFALDQVAHGAHQFTREKTAEEFIHNHQSLFQADSPEVLTGLRFKVGDQKAQKIVATWSAQLFSKNVTKCDAYIGTCDFYLCQEQNNPCGVDGYNLGFGYKYCSGSKFKLWPQMHTELGKSWVQNVFQCLQKKNFVDSLTQAKAQTCESIHKTSVASHPDCYVEAGFCNLSNSDRLAIFNLIKSEILSTDTVTQGLRILQLCRDKDLQ